MNCARDMKTCLDGGWDPRREAGPSDDGRRHQSGGHQVAQSSSLTITGFDSLLQDSGSAIMLCGSGSSCFSQCGSGFSLINCRAVDPHSFYADPDMHPAVFLNADPDPGPGPA